MMPNYTLDDLRASIRELLAIKESILDLPFWKELAILKVEPQDQDQGHLNAFKFLDFKEELLHKKITMWSQWTETEKILKELISKVDGKVKKPKLYVPQKLNLEDALDSVEFKIGGSSFTTQVDTVMKAPESRMAAMMKAMMQGQQYEDIDRDPERFQLVVNYLRNDFQMPKAMPAQRLIEMVGELRFWKIPLMKPSLEIDINDILARDPILDFEVNPVPLAKWRMLKPLTVAKILSKKPEACIYNSRVQLKRFEDSYRTGQLHPETGRPCGICRLVSQTKIQEGFVDDSGENGWYRVIWPKGDYYVGHWEAGKKHGLGKYVNPKGKVKKGKWVENKFKG